MSPVALFLKHLLIRVCDRSVRGESDYKTNIKELLHTVSLNSLESIYQCWENWEKRRRNVCFPSPTPDHTDAYGHVM